MSQGNAADHSPAKPAGKMRASMSRPTTFADGLKLVALTVGLIVTIGGAFIAWGKLSERTTISDVTTKEKLRAIELRHEKDHEQTRTFLQEVDDDLHELDKKQEVMRTEQKSQTEKLDRIIDKLEEEPNP